MAAIVGLAGAYLATWLLSRRGEAVTERRRYLDTLFSLMSRLQDLKNRANTLSVGIAGIVREIHDQRNAGRAHQDLQIPQFETLSHTSYVVPHPTQDDLAVLETLPDLYNNFDLAIVTSRAVLAQGILDGQPLPVNGDPTDYRRRDLATSPFHVSGIDPQNFWSGLRQQRDMTIWRWQEISRDYDALATSVRDFRERLIPASIYFLVVVLLILAAVGIIAPLSFLTARPDASKCILLSVSAPLVISFVAYLGYAVRKLRQAANLALDNI